MRAVKTIPTMERVEVEVVARVGFFPAALAEALAAEREAEEADLEAAEEREEEELAARLEAEEAELAATLEREEALAEALAEIDEADLPMLRFVVRLLMWWNLKWKFVFECSDENL